MSTILLWSNKNKYYDEFLEEQNKFFAFKEHFCIILWYIFFPVRLFPDQIRIIWRAVTLQFQFFCIGEKNGEDSKKLHPSMGCRVYPEIE